MGMSSRLDRDEPASGPRQAPVDLIDATMAELPAAGIMLAGSSVADGSIDASGATVAADSSLPTLDSGGDVAPRSRSVWHGQQLGRFELIRPVGSGSFGTVYEARDPKLDRIVAVKVLHAGHMATAEQVDRFFREARNAAQLRHPAIVPVYEFGEHDGVPYIVSEFILGTTLADRMVAGRVSHAEGAALVIRVAEALDYAHAEGVVHRDIKPSNIMIDERGRPLLLDFGVAKRETGEATMTHHGDLLGTPAYMSPEQARGESHEVDGRSDEYSLGVILYALLTGEMPFRGSLRMLLMQVLQEEPRSPRSLDETIPRDLETICLKAMAKEPDRRYATAGALADDLGRFARGEPIVARPVRWTERGWKWCRRNPRLAWAGVAVAAATLLTIAVLASATLILRAANLREAEARRRAQAGLQIASDAVDRFVTRAGEDPQLLDPRSYRVRKELLEQARDFYGKILQDVADEPRLQVEHARSCVRLAGILLWFRECPEAITQCRQARTVLLALPAEEQDLATNRALLARSLYLSGRAFLDRNKPYEALADCREAAKIYDRLAWEYPANPLHRSAQCANLLLVGALLCRLPDQIKEGVEVLHKCLMMSREQAQMHPEELGFLGYQAQALANLGHNEEYSQHFDEARVTYSEALRIYRDLTNRQPGDPGYRYWFIEGLVNLILVELNSDHVERARTIYDEALPLLERTAGDFGEVAAFRNLIARADAFHAGVLAKLGHHAAAVSATERLVRRVPDMPGILYLAANAISLAAGVLDRDQDLDVAHRIALHNQYCRQVNDLLCAAQRGGFFNDPYWFNVILTDADFDPLRGDPDFDRFINDLRSHHRAQHESEPVHR